MTNPFGVRRGPIAAARAAIGGFLFFGIVHASLAEDKAQTPTIAVVKTWKELQDQSPIDLGDGVKIRLGLEMNKIPQWSGGYVYCLTEGYVPAATIKGRPLLGPLVVSFLFENDRELVETVKAFGEMKDWPKGSYLFARPLIADRVGSYRLRPRLRKGATVAVAEIQGARDFFHPWTPWLQGYQDHQSPWEGIALPNGEGMAPLAFIEAGKKRVGDLPTYLPSDKAPGLAINLSGKTVTIRSKRPFTTSRPEYHFLARWWVNDKPFVPKQIEEFPLSAGYGRVSEDTELKLDVRLRADRLGAKPGDKIGLQLMHSEGCWDWVRDQRMTKLARRRDGSESIRVSNRIDFIVPKVK